MGPFGHPSTTVSAVLILFSSRPFSFVHNKGYVWNYDWSWYVFKTWSLHSFVLFLEFFSSIKMILFLQVSSVEIERVCNAVDSNVLETAAIGVPPPQGGPEQLVIAVVFKDSDDSTVDLDKLRISFNSAVQKKLNPLFRVINNNFCTAHLY